MSLAGMGIVALWHDLVPDAKEEFYEWHSRERMPERVGIPGFRRGRRYVAVNGAPEFFVLYEADSPEVLGGLDFLEPAQRAVGLGAARRAVVSQRRPFDLPCRRDQWHGQWRRVADDPASQSMPRTVPVRSRR